MALDFPAAPSIGTIFSGGGSSWRWDGTKWVPAKYGSFTISDTAPAAPNPSDMWFDSVGCQTYIWYTDPTSSQWVPLVNQLGGTVVTGVTPPPTPQPGTLWFDANGGQLYLYFNDGNSSQWVAISSTGQAPAPLGGYLSVVGASPSNQLQFLPFNGNQIQINGLRYTIPNTGIAGLTNTGCYVEGVAGQSLVASVLYRVYCFNNNGVLTADFSQTAHATSQSPGNAGVEIRSGDDTRTFIGLVYMAGGTGLGSFYDTAQYRYTRSWVNRKRISFSTGLSGSLSATSSVTIFNAYFVSFADEAFIVSTQWTGYFPGGAATAYTGNALDGTGLGTNYNVTAGAANSWIGAALYMSAQTTEGYHTLAFNGSVSALTLQYYAYLSGTVG